MGTLQILDELLESNLTRLGLDTLDDAIAPATAEMIEASKFLGPLVYGRDEIERVAGRLLAHANRHRRVLGLKVLRESIRRTGDEAVPHMMEHLDDPYPWAAYEATWGLLATRVATGVVLDRLVRRRLESAPPGSPEELITRMIDLYLEHVRQRRREAEVVTRPRREPALGISLEVPVSWQKKGSTIAGLGIHWKRVLELSQATGMIQLESPYPPEVTLALSSLESPASSARAVIQEEEEETFVTGSHLVAGGIEGLLLLKPAVGTALWVRQLVFVHSGRIVRLSGMTRRTDLEIWERPLLEILLSVRIDPD